MKSNDLQVLSTKIKGKKVESNYYHQPTNRNRNEEIQEQPHGDYVRATKALSKYIYSIFTTASPDSKDELKDRYVATGFKETKDDVISISGKFVSENGREIGISTPSIDLNSSDFGFEVELSSDIGELKTEAALLISKEKLGVEQVEMFPEDSDDINENKEDSDENSEDSEENEETPDFPPEFSGTDE